MAHTLQQNRPARQEKKHQTEKYWYKLVTSLCLFASAALSESVCGDACADVDVIKRCFSAVAGAAWRS